MLSFKVKLCTGVMLLAVILIEPVTSDCTSDLAALKTPRFTLNEGAKNGSWSFNATDDGDIQIVGSQSFFRTEGGILILEKDFEIDGPQNKDLCTDYGSQFTIRIKCAQVNTEAFLLFRVNLIQDKPLRFQNSSYHVEKREQNYGDAIVMDMTGEAVDNDCGHPRINYRIKDEGSGSQPFSISKGVITTTSILDYEEHNNYTLTVEAFTQGSVTQTATTKLTISVVDIDDEDPRFEHSSYSLNVDEETNVTGTWLTSDPPLKAVDGDKGLNETIQYSVVVPVRGLDVDVDSSTGRIKIKTVLDRETKSQYTVGVKASQANNPLRSTTATLTINVADVNDHHPVFLNRQGEVITVKEGTPEGTYITSVQATDEDEGDNAEFTYRLTDPSGAFGLEKDAMSGTRWIVLKNSSALEGRDRVDVQVLLEPKVPKLIDGEICDFVDSCVLNITMDVSTTTTTTATTTTTTTATSPTTSTTIITNQHTPIFQKSDYSFIYNQTETLLGHVSATDEDSGPSGTISYSLRDLSSGCDGLNVTINNKTGSMETLGTDVSVGFVCFLKAQACDMPTTIAEQKCATVPVTILSQNANIKQKMTVSVLENVPIGTIITKLPESNLTVNDDRFSIKKDDLVTEKLLDRESNFVIKVFVFKNEENAITLYEVSITLENVNDNAPIFGKEVYPVFLDRFDGDTHTGGTLLVTADAQDADGLSIDPLTYSLLEESDWLSIGNKTGKVWLEAPPPLGEMGDKFTLHVKVTDSGTPPLSDTALVEIYRPLYKTSIYITLPLPLDEVNKRKTEITSFLTDTLKYSVTIESVEQIDNVPAWSKVLIMAQRKNGDWIARDALESMVSTHQATIQAEYIEDDDDDVLTTPFIIVLCLAILLFLLLIAVWIMSIRTKRRLKEKASIFRTSIHSSTMYDNVGTTRSNKLYDTLLTNETETLERNGVVNPVFKADCDEENGEGNSQTMAEESGNDTSQRRDSRDDGEDLEMSEEYPDRSYHLEADASITRIDEVLALQSPDGEERTDDLADSVSGSDNDGDIVDPVVNSPAFSGSDGFYPSLEGEGDESGSGVGEGDESVSGVGSSPQLPHSNADIWDTAKNSDADSGMPSDRDDLANDNDDDDNNDDDDGDDGDDRDMSPVGFFSKVRKDFDRPVQKHVTNITIGLTNLENEEDTHSYSMEPSLDEPEPDYGKKVRFEGAGDGGDGGQTDSNRDFFSDTQTTAF